MSGSDTEPTQDPPPHLEGGDETTVPVQEESKEHEQDAAPPDPPSDSATALRTEEVEQQANDNVQALTDEINALRNRVSQLDHQLASAEEENARLETQHSNLSHSFAQIQRELAELAASTKFVAAAKDAVDKELAEEKQKRETAEETVEVLRGKVDDARKAFGTLQKQDKRASTILVGSDSPGLDALGISSLDDTTTGSSSRARSSKRASILFGANARRPSNASEHDHPNTMMLTPPQIASMTTPTLPQVPVNSKGLRELRLSSASPSGLTGTPGGMPPSPNTAATTTTLDPNTDSGSNRWSGLNFGGGSRPSPAKGAGRELRDEGREDPVEELDDASKRHGRPALAAHRVSSSSFTTAGTGAAVVDLTSSPEARRNDDRFDALQLEIARLRSQLEESQEARVASEECLKALRDFIAGSHGGSTTDPAGGISSEAEHGFAGIKLPPLPTDRDAEADEQMSTLQQEKKSGGTGWGLGLWRASAPTNAVPAQSITTSTRSEAGDLRSTASAAQSPVLGSDKQLPAFPLVDEQDAQNPLMNFVSSWSRGVPAGTPKIEAPPAALLAAPSPANAKKGFSFFARSASDRDVTVAAAEDTGGSGDGGYVSATLTADKA